MKHSERLGTEKIAPLLLRLSVPAGMGMLSMALYNVVDTIFVGRGVGTMAIGGVSIVMPIQTLIFSAAQTIGIGGASIISRGLGAKNTQLAQRTFDNLSLLTFLMSLAVLLVGYLFSDEVLFLFGSSGKIAPFARDYYLIILSGTPFLNFSMVFNSVVRAEGNAKVSMYTMMIAAALNIIFDPIFIFGFDLGVRGAAMASVLSQILTFAYLVWHFLGGKSHLRFSRAWLIADFAIIRETLAIGASSLARHGAGSVLAAILNHSLFTYGGELSVAVYGVINRLFRITFMPLFGLVQGFLPIAGYNYGARNYQRVRDVFKTSVRVSTLMVLIIFTVLMVFARPLFSLFSTDVALIDHGSFALRAMIAMIPIVGFQIIGAGYFQALGKALPAFFLALARQVLFLIPLVLIIPGIWGLNGIWFSFPVADALAGLITFFMLLPELRNLKNKTAAVN